MPTVPGVQHVPPDQRLLLFLSLPTLALCSQPTFDQRSTENSQGSNPSAGNTPPSEKRRAGSMAEEGTPNTGASSMAVRAPTQELVEAAWPDGWFQWILLSIRGLLDSVSFPLQD